MKNKTIYRLMVLLVMAASIFAACTEDTADVRLEPTLSTANMLNISSDSATVVGFVIADGDGFTERGICYSTTETPTVDDNIAVYTEDNLEATFYVTLTGLDYATTYYARAYATGESGTVYGDQVTFTTLPVVPFLTTADISDITGNSANGGGEVTGNGGAEVTERGICFSTDENPTIDDSKTSDGEGTGAFESALSELQGNTTYYVRAYATNSAGTGYGPQVSFTTLVDLPQVTTASVSEVGKTSALAGGAVVNDGGDDISSYGIAWGLSSEPTISDNVLEPTMDMDSFVVELADLSMSTTYYVRAFATNSAGTAYGETVSFTTLADITKFWVVGNYNGWDNSDAASYIISTESSEGLAEGYVYLTSGEIKLVTDHSWDDAHTFGDDGSGGLTNPGNNITVAEDGYYLIQANLSDMTYSLVKTEWGVIGSATPDGWNDETPLSYRSSLDMWTGGIHLTADEVKFRANHDWTYNYGSNDADGNLQSGGANIAVDLEADYAVSLNLSTPNEYTYSINRWGVIGDATPGGWSDDTDMTWDADNEVFTVTLELTAASFKFRANDGWDVNYGGDLGALSSDGDNISVAEAGNYTITFDPWGLTATVTKN